MQDSTTIGLAIRNFILDIEDRNERLVFLEKIKFESTIRGIYEICDELRGFVEGDSCKETSVPCGTKREISLDREDEEGSDEDHDAEYDDLPLSYYGYQGDELA